MPAPLAIPLVLAIARIAIIALSVHEALDVLSELYEGLDKYNKGVDEAKKQLEKLIRGLKDEIDKKIEEKEEMAILLAAEGADPQSEVTKRGKGRGASNQVIIAAIQQKIPFRKVISEVCEKADSMPVLQLRKKKGVQLKDMPRAKRKALEELLRLSVEEIADVDLDNFILVRLKQLTASLMFEFIDYCIDWASPMKCEVSFGPPTGFADHPIQSGTRLKRVGKVSPFYPFPSPNNRKDSISADLIITEYRKKPCGKNNIFAIVEIKFPGDKIDSEQFEKYDDLLKEAARIKNKKSPVRFDNRTVSLGGRLSLFRYPEDKAADMAEDKQQPRKTPGKTR